MGIFMKLLMGIVAIILFVSFALAFVPSAGSAIHTTRQTSASESLSCTVAVGGNSCSVTLSDPHVHGTLAHATITETAPGSVNRTSSSSLAVSNHQTVTVGNATTPLTASTTYTFAIAYEKRATGVSVLFDDLAKLIVPIIVVAVIVGTTIGLGKVMLSRGGGP